MRVWSVAVIISAYNAAATIGRAVRSALLQDEISECIVVNDASIDATASAAAAADDGTGRLRIINMPHNSGPAAARNAALQASRSDFVAILDADDYFAPGRMRRLLATTDDFDFLADDIYIVPEGRDGEHSVVLKNIEWDRSASMPCATLDLTRFVRSNIPKRARSRGELGFLKPVVKRSFLERTGLGYNPQLKFGEDYAFYVQALMLGARFKVAGPCGYVAVERAGSLSSSHTSEDLARLAAFDLRCLKSHQLSRRERVALRRHYSVTRREAEFRKALQVRSDAGLVSGLAFAVRRPFSLHYMIAEAMRAKWKRTGLRRNTEFRGARLLIGPADWN
jgi:succinoglycan biosynthesis protein ExoU